MLGAFGSEPVRQAVYEFGTLAAKFRSRATQVTAVVEHGERSGPLYAHAWEPMDDLREEARQKLRAIEAMIQAELLRT